MMPEKELLERDAKRDIGAELLESVKEMKAGKVGDVHQVSSLKKHGVSENIINTALNDVAHG